MPTTEEPVQEGSASADHVKAVAWMAVDPPGRTPPEPKRSRRGPLGVLGKITGPAARYPRVTIEAVLTAASIALGLWFLPAAGSAVAPPQAAIQSLLLTRSANVPTYVLDRSADINGPDNEVIIGMDVPATNQAVQWKLYIIYNVQDQVIDRNLTTGVTFGQVLSPADTGIPGYQALEVTGSIKPGSRSYTEFQNGFLQTVNQNGLLNGGQSEPKDAAKVDFVVSGPVPVTAISGASMAVSLPGIAPYDPNAPTSQTPAPFNAEMLYDAGPYQSQTGGPTIQAGTNWDWFSHNAILQATTATGLNNGESRTEENNLFLAAVFFGLSAAAGAAFAVELVEAVQEHRRANRAAVMSSGAAE